MWAWNSGFNFYVNLVFHGGKLLGVSCYTNCLFFSQNVFCNPTFELEGEREEKVEGFSSASTVMSPEPVKNPAANSESDNLVSPFHNII